MRHVAVLLSCALSLALPAVALAQPSASEDMLFSGATGPQLRARLMSHADTIQATDKSEAARALGFCGHSFARDGARDSSIAAFRGAFELDPYRRYEIADALLFRQGPGDAQQAIGILRPIQPDNPQLPDRSYQHVQGMMAWAQFLAGRPDSAAHLFLPVESWLSEQQDWRYRMACVAMTLHDWKKAIILLTPLALASRNQDVDVMDMLNEAGEKLGGRQYLMPTLTGNLAARDRLEGECLTEMGARRVVFHGRDGTSLGGVLFTPRTPARPRAVVMLAAPATRCRTTTRWRSPCATTGWLCCWWTCAARGCRCRPVARCRTRGGAAKSRCRPSARRTCGSRCGHWDARRKPIRRNT